MVAAASVPAVTEWPAIVAAARGAGLAPVGAFHPGHDDGAPQGTRTLVLLGPDGPGMWQVFKVSPEYRDGRADPLDRWSRRVIGGLAETLDGIALFPFGGPPWLPFQRWAAAGEDAVASPVAMQATPGRGLWASYRGALAFTRRLAIKRQSPAPGAPCRGCAAPCVTACPVDAFQDGRYDAVRCVAHLSSPLGADCRAGCLVRRACPAGAAMRLPAEQHTFHMRAFLEARR